MLFLSYAFYFSNLWSVPEISKIESILAFAFKFFKESIPENDPFSFLYDDYKLNKFFTFIEKICAIRIKIIT